MLYYLQYSGVGGHQPKGGLADGVPGFDSRAMHAQPKVVWQRALWPADGGDEVQSELKLTSSMLCRGCSHSHGQEQLSVHPRWLSCFPHTQATAVLSPAPPRPMPPPPPPIAIIVIAAAVLLDVVTLLTMAIMTTSTTTTITTTVICGVQGFARAAIRGGLQGRGGMVCGT